MTSFHFPKAKQAREAKKLALKKELQALHQEEMKDRLLASQQQQLEKGKSSSKISRKGLREGEEEEEEDLEMKLGEGFN